MKFIRRTEGQFIRPQKEWRNFRKKLKVDSVENKLAQYKQKWLNHVSNLEDIRYPKLLFDIYLSEKVEDVVSRQRD
jgi:hypothetical protein